MARHRGLANIVPEVVVGQGPVVPVSLRRIEQARRRRGRLAEQSIGYLDMLRLLGLSLSQITLGTLHGISDHARIGLQLGQSQQRVVRDGTLIRGDSKPEMVWVELHLSPQALRAIVVSS